MSHIPREFADALAHRFALEGPVGSGATATVYRARDLKLGRPVALKVLDPALSAAIGVERFQREVRIAARLNHPHILVLMDSGEAAGRLYYVMPLVEGGSLADRIAARGRLPVDEAVRLADQVASALGHAHGTGVVHRDVKPANILLHGDQAIVADFGIARALEAAGDETLTATGAVVGTPVYMSPEQAFEQATVDGRSDLYALGCVLFEMLTGSPPFESRRTVALLARHATQPPPALRSRLPEAPVFLERAVQRLLAKTPGDRFQTAEELLEVLRGQVVVAPTGRRRVAVLPPVPIGGRDDSAHLVMGLHEALISGAGKADVGVLARTSVLHLGDGDSPTREVAASLGVEALVESSLFCVGESMSIQLRLVDGLSGEATWSDSFDGELSGIFPLFRDAAGALRRKLAQDHGVRVSVGGGTPAGTSGSGRTDVDPRAYELYLRGRVAQSSFNPADLYRSVEFYEAALEIQPDFARAYAGLSLAYGSMYVLGMLPLPAGEAHTGIMARKAIELDPGLAQGHQALAQYLTWTEFDWDAAEAAFRRAIQLDPNEPETRTFFCHFLAMHGRVEEADLHAAKALELDPFNPFARMLVGIEKGITGRIDAGREILADVPPNPLRAFALSWFDLCQGNLAAGRAHYRDYFTMLGNGPVAEILDDDGLGFRPAMIRAAETLVAQAGEQFVKPNNMVHLFAWGGDNDRAMEWIRYSRETRDHEIAYLGCGISPVTLQRDPRFQAFLREMGLPWEPRG